MVCVMEEKFFVTPDEKETAKEEQKAGKKKEVKFAKLLTRTRWK